MAPLSNASWIPIDNVGSDSRTPAFDEGVVPGVRTTGVLSGPGVTDVDGVVEPVGIAGRVLCIKSKCICGVLIRRMWSTYIKLEKNKSKKKANRKQCCPASLSGVSRLNIRYP